MARMVSEAHIIWSSQRDVVIELGVVGRWMLVVISLDDAKCLIKSRCLLNLPTGLE